MMVRDGRKRKDVPDRAATAAAPTASATEGSSMRIRIALIAGFALLAAGGATAAPRLTLPAAVDTALQHSPQVLQAQALREQAAAGRREAQASRLPSLQVREIALRTDSPADAFGLQLMQERFDFPAFTQSNPNDPTALNNYATEFEVMWPVFTGGRVMAGIGQADNMARAAAAVSGHTQQAIALATASAYMDAVLAQRAVELAQKARDTTAKHVDQAQAFFDTGMMVESDLLQARVHLARMEQTLISARNGALLARAGLFRVMGIAQNSDYELDPDVAPAPAEAALDSLTLPDALAGAHQRRRDVQAVAAQVEAARLGIRRARGEYLPELVLVGKYALNADNVFGRDGDSTTLMAMARWNLWNWGQTGARVSGARSAHVAAQQAQRAHDQQVEFEVRQAWQQVAEARARWDVARGAVAQAERALDILDARFAQGVTRVTDLLDAETMLDDARVRELNAGFDLRRAARSLAFTVGQSPVPEVTR
jgi:outer membrane protein TolC